MDRKDVLTLVGSLAVAGLVGLGLRSFRFGKVAPAASASAAAGGDAGQAPKAPEWTCMSQCSAQRVTPDLAAKLNTIPRESRILVLQRPSNDDFATIRLSPPLQVLILEEPVGPIDLSPMAEVDITTVNLQRATVSSFAPFASMSTKVVMLNYVSGADSLAPLGEMKELQDLRIQGSLFAPLATLASLKGSPTITTLALGESDMTNLDGIEELPQLTELQVMSTRHLDFSVLPKLEHLQKLILIDVGLEALPDLPPHVTRVALGIGHIPKPVFVHPPRELTSLNLDQNDVVDVSAIAKVTALTELILSHNENLKDITPLASLTKLTTLSLFGTGVASLEPLQGLPLEKLSLYNTKVRSLAPLRRIPTLRFVNGLLPIVPDSEIDALKKANPQVQISRR